MNFCSDNVAVVAPEIMAAIEAANHGPAMAYGADEATGRLEARLTALFETDVAVFPVATGTAANSLALSAIAPPYGAIYCHELAHIHVDECGAPELFTGGAKLIALPGEHGKLAATDLAAAIHFSLEGGVHRAQPAAISLTQVTECGTLYRPDELRPIAALAREHGLRLHMDGARFANAVAALGCAPADITWRAGIDVLSLGATKNGALAAEAVVVFDRELAQTMRYRRRRGGHLFSKMRFVSVQLEAFLAHDLWLRNARHANAMARRVREGLAQVPGVRFRSPTEINFVLVTLPQPVWDGLVAEGYSFSRRGAPSEGIIRIACAFDTSEDAVDALVAAAHRYAGTQHGIERPAPATR
jgi:threonine aldolase